MNWLNNEVGDRHKRRWLEYDTEASEYLNQSIDEFNELVNDSLNPTVHSVQYTLPREINIENKLECNVVVEDVARDDTSMDKKIIHTKLDSDIDCGSYVWWNNDAYIISNEDKNSVGSYKTFVIRKCFINISIKYKGIVYTFPVSVKNLTLYDDGLSENVDISLTNGKRSVLIASNPITDELDIDFRMIIGRKTVFRVSMIDDFTNEGTYTLTLIQTVFNSKDDKENGLAYNEEFEMITQEITGENYIFLGTEFIYECIGVTTWETSNENIIITNLGDKCKVKCPNDNTLNGESFKLIADGNIEKEIQIRGWF